MDELLELLQRIKKNEYKINNYDNLSEENGKLKRQNEEIKKENLLLKKQVRFYVAYTEELEERFGKKICPECNGEGGFILNDYGDGEICGFCGGTGRISLEKYNEYKNKESKSNF